MSNRPLSVFISSTCYDLGDLRYEVAEMLRSNSCVVSMSDDPESAFYVDPLEDSIQSCLLNVEAADVVLCFIDRRYGGVLRTGQFSGKSATHAEVQHARSHRKPIFFFVREAAFREYEQLRFKPTYKTVWVEPNKTAARQLWFKFMSEVAALPTHSGWSNWCDLFRFSTDLKPLVQKRLSDHFKQQFALPALQPGRIVRMTFKYGGSGSRACEGAFLNCGPGPVFCVRHGCTWNDEQTTVGEIGALRDGDISAEHGISTTYIFKAAPPAPGLAGLYCEYQNPHGDRYRVNVPLVPNARGTQLHPAREQFFVRTPGGDWLEVESM